MKEPGLFGNPTGIWIETQYIWFYCKGMDYYSSIGKHITEATVYKLNIDVPGCGRRIFSWGNDWRFTRTRTGFGSMDAAKAWCMDMMNHWDERLQEDN